MKSICIYFQVHQPFRLRTFRFFDIGHLHDYFDEYANRYLTRQLADKCYLPANKILLDMLKKSDSDFKVTFSISGMALEQFELYTPEVIESFKKLAKTGKVEFLAETYSHSLASLKSKSEFFRQVKLHEEKIQELFGVKPLAFRNTELIYNDEIGNLIYELGYNTVLTEGPKHILGWKSPNLLYCSAANPKLKLLMKNFQLSDDIAFRFSVQQWSEWPLTAEKFAGWINELDSKTEVVNLFMDYETFGQNQSENTGIFNFLKALPKAINEITGFNFQTPSFLGKNMQVASPLHVPYPISWADEERDITAWLGNEMQNEAYSKLYELQPYMIKCKNQELINDWNRLQISDHFYYMSTKWFSEGTVKTRLNPYNSPYDAFINYMNVLVDFEIRVKRECEKADDAEATISKPRTRVKKTASTVKAQANKSESTPKKSKPKTKKTT
jgi:alpha-amylase